MSKLFDPERNPDSPLDILHDVSDVIAAIDLAVSFGHELMNEKTSRGLGLLLMATAKAVDDASGMVERLVSEPYGAGYRKGMDFAAQEYRRGFSEGRKAAGVAA